ncbi:unnamed protein product [Closterium sp. Yama58-4]|nr:unnamed protein product [Closterium sp. Yama58-4]
MCRSTSHRAAIFSRRTKTTFSSRSYSQPLLGWFLPLRGSNPSLSRLFLTHLTACPTFPPPHHPTCAPARGAMAAARPSCRLRAAVGVKVPSAALHSDRPPSPASLQQLSWELLPCAGDPLAATAAASPLASISAAFAPRTAHHPNSQDAAHAAAATRGLCFARIQPPRPAPSRGGGAAGKKVEYYSVRRVHADGRCMFRALVSGMAANKNMALSPADETREADELRLAVADALCGSEKRRAAYEEALIAITVEESLQRYCQRITRPDFWGGESELLVLSRMCSQPIIVYIPESKARQGARWGGGVVPIAEYGSEFGRAAGAHGNKPRKAVRLLYNGTNHYDLLL